MIEDECSFCNMQKNPDQSVALVNCHCMFLRKQQDVLIGSGVIVPINHRDTVFDLTLEEWNAMYDMLQKAKQLIDSEYQPQGYNVGWNCGEVGGQKIMHAHMHVIARFADEPLAGKGIRHWMKQPENKRLHE